MFSRFEWSNIKQILLEILNSKKYIYTNKIMFNMQNVFLKRLVSIIVLFILFSNLLLAQDKGKHVNYTKYPYWISMMNDPQVNYFEAVKAYDNFWAKHKKPREENEIIGQKKEAKPKQNVFQRLFKSHEEEDTDKYSLDCKKFEHWKLIVKPYVQENGRILSADEQLNIWKQQRQK